MMRETRNTVAKIECKDRADDGGVVTRGMSCEVNPFCSGGVRSVGVSARPFLCPPQMAMRWQCKAVHDSRHWPRF